jgi:hypothetical protein
MKIHSRLFTFYIKEKKVVFFFFLKHLYFQRVGFRKEHVEVSNLCTGIMTKERGFRDSVKALGPKAFDSGLRMQGLGFRLIRFIL